MPPRSPIHLLPRTSSPSLLRLPHLTVQQPSKRTFLSSLLSSAAPSSAPQTLSATRRLPYTHNALYDVIADIDSYSAFLPYCSVSRVTAWTTTPDDNGRRWPTRADLTAGWGGLEQTYTSRVLCIPGSVVEALSGAGARSGISLEVLAAHGLRDEPSPGRCLSTHKAGEQKDGEEGVFKTLVTRWTVTPVLSMSSSNGAGSGAIEGQAQAREWSDVHLDIRFQFANPLYSAVSSAVADKVAPIMIEAFVDRANKILG